MGKDKNRLIREKKTIEAMVKLFCKKKHNTVNICTNCNEVLNYALTRIEKCVFGEKKPVCNLCKIHCYNKENKSKIKKIMRFSGPRMIFYHPYYAIMHLIDKKKYL